MAAYYNELGLLLMLIVANHVNGAPHHCHHPILIVWLPIPDPPQSTQPYFKF